MMLMGVSMPLPAIRRQIASGIDLIIHLGRLRDRSRRVLEIAEIIGFHEEEIALQSLYQFKEYGEDRDGKIIGGLEQVSSLTNTQKLEQKRV